MNALIDAGDEDDVSCNVETEQDDDDDVNMSELGN